MKVLLPGSEIIVDKQMRLGPGLRRDFDDDAVFVTESGLLKSANNMAWVESARKRYIPSKGDLVLGVVTHKHPEYYRVDINAPEFATLAALSFESATKRNKVTVNIGDLVYGKVSVALPDLEPEMVCCNQRSGKSEGMGIMQINQTTHSLNVNIQAARKALSNECTFAAALSKYTAFEWCIGVNGRVMVTTKDSRLTSKICRIFPMITFLNNEQIEKLVYSQLSVNK